MDDVFDDPHPYVEFPANHVFTEEDRRAQAINLGIDPDTEQHLLWLTWNYIFNRLPPDWTFIIKGHFRNTVTGECVEDLETLYSRRVVEEREKARLQHSVLKVDGMIETDPPNDPRDCDRKERHTLEAQNTRDMECLMAGEEEFQTEIKRFDGQIEEERKRIRGEMEDERKKLHGEMEEERKRFHGEMEEQRKRFHGDMEEGRKRFHRKMEEERKRFHGEMEEERKRLHGEMEEREK